MPANLEDSNFFGVLKNSFHSFKTLSPANMVNATSCVAEVRQAFKPGGETGIRVALGARDSEVIRGIHPRSSSHFYPACAVRGCNL